MLHLKELIEAYRAASSGIAGRIKASKYKAQWFMKGVGLGSSPSAYYRRIKTGDWTPAQLLKFAYLLEGQEIPAALTETK